MHPSIIWFRSDLRVDDNVALWHASQRGQIVGIYYSTPMQWQTQDMADCRATFQMRCLATLSESLESLGIPLIYRELNYYRDIAEDIRSLALDLGSREVFWNREYPVNEIRRDQLVREGLEKSGILVREFDDTYILPPGSVTKSDGSSYQVFTPFSKSWKEQIAAGSFGLLPSPAQQERPSCPDTGSIPDAPSGFKATTADSFWPAGERPARQQLQNFIADQLFSYADQRDIPELNATSRLSPYLSVGALSARVCLSAALAVNQGELFGGAKGATTWINQLIWRDFYGHILHANPRLSMRRAFRLETEKVAWRHDQAIFAAWCDGRTGVPLIDAAMRQLTQTGWMHNRLRMVVAMYLAKNLLLDWRLGEQYFMRHLIDGDLAQNNGGWQWSASTGTDAVPYFRIFNPFSQAKRFDPDGSFIREWVPELAQLPSSILHDMKKLAKNKPDNYPDQLVDLAPSRARALEAFKRIRSGR